MAPGSARRSSTALLAVLFGIAVALGACGDDDGADVRNVGGEDGGSVSGSGSGSGSVSGSGSGSGMTETSEAG